MSERIQQDDHKKWSSFSFVRVNHVMMEIRRLNTRTGMI